MEPPRPKKKVVLKPMFFKKLDLSKVELKKPETPSTSIATAPSSSKAVDTKSPTASQGSIPSTSRGSKRLQKEEEINDLEIWGRAKDVHAGMEKVKEEKRHKEAEARRQKAKAEKDQKNKGPVRSSKRRKSDEGTTITLSDDNNDEKDSDYLPRKKSRDPTLTPRTSVEPVDPSEIDKILAAYKKKKAELDADVAAQAARSFSPPISTHLYANQQATSTDPNDAFKDIVIQILIVSQIPGTKPMIYNRKFGQTLGKVRDTWARMQGFTEDQIASLVLVWQNETRVFDSTLPRSLGIRFDKNGKMFLNSKGKRESFTTLDRDERRAVQEGISPEECKIYFDAMWDEEYDALMKRKEAANERENALELSSDHEDDDEVVTGIALNAQMIEVILKGKHFAEMKLKVKPTMKVSELIDMMRDERKLDEDTEIELRFDGEELDEDVTLEEADIEDEFQIDVVLR